MLGLLNHCDISCQISCPFSVKFLDLLVSNFLFIERQICCPQAGKKKQGQNKRNEEPEWFTYGPSSQFETMELKGFDSQESSDHKKGIVLNVKLLI